MHVVWTELANSTVRDGCTRVTQNADASPTLILKEDCKGNEINLSYQLYFQRYENALEHYKWPHAFFTAL